MGLYSLCAAAALAGRLGAVTAAHGQVVAYNGHFYGVTTTAGSWLQAEAEAVARGGHLTAITTAAESDFIINTFLTAAPPDARPHWIGLSDAAVEGQFAWSTGEALGFSNWFAGEPNNSSPDGGEDYAAINWHRSLGLTPTPGEWNDVPLAGTSQASPQTDGPYRGIFELPPLPADFDENGAVAAADLAKWRMGLGMTAGALHASGDANGDGDVDGGDFLAWQRELGQSRLATSVSVPEPAARGLAAGAAVLASILSHRIRFLRCSLVRNAAL